MFSESDVIRRAAPPSAGVNRPEARQHARPTIAVLVDYMTLFGGGYEKELRLAFESAAERAGVDLLCVYGRPLAHPDAWSAAHNFIYDLIHPEWVDGMVVLSASLSSFTGPSGLRAFLQRFADMALCSAGVAVAGVASVVIDNRAGMSAVVSHLIRVHGAKRVAFIGGPSENPDAQARYAAYRQTLAEHAIDFDPSLVGEGDFVRRSGEAVMQDILARGGKPDAVVVANDAMALGAISALKQNGLRVPHDVLVTGFDDLEQARLGDPPLTTVGQPIVELAEHSLSLVLEQLSNRSVPSCTVLPATFIPRKSCGCTLRVSRSPGQAPRDRALLEGALKQRVSHLLENLRDDPVLRVTWGDAAYLLAALDRELGGGAHAFQAAIESLIDRPQSDNEHYPRLQMAITRLREELRDVTTPELQDLWDEARVLLALSNTQTQVQRRLEHDEIYHRLIEHGERLNSALDLKALQVILQGSLPSLGVQDADISRYLETGQLELLVKLRGGSVHGPSNLRFDAHQLLPRDTKDSQQRRTSLVFPLVFEGRKLGVAVFEHKLGMNGWQVIRDQISAALHSVLLHQELVEQATQHERASQEQERMATSKRLQSLSVLAGGVAHDLNNVLGPLIGLPDVILDELERQDFAANTREQVRADITVIRSAALRAAQTIKDLLTLSQEGQTSKEPLDLNGLVSGCIAQDSLGFTREARRRVNVVLDLLPEPVLVEGSESQLTRVVANLVRNALEASGDGAQVRIQTRSLTVRQPLSGYEIVPPGSYAVITVSDAGKGIPRENIGRIFEPFFSSKRLGDQSGSGLGLAIVRGVVKEHGGFIDVCSEVNRGTTFTLYLPRVSAALRRPAVTSELPRGSAKILVIDDEPVQLRTASRVLTQLGYQVETCNSGKKAYELFAESHARSEDAADEGGAVGRAPYDLILCDMLLNESCDGLEIIQQIEGLYPHQRAIIASGHAASERMALAASRGILWLSKPYTSAALAQIVRDALRPAQVDARIRASSAPAPSSSRSQPATEQSQMR